MFGQPHQRGEVAGGQAAAPPGVEQQQPLLRRQRHGRRGRLDEPAAPATPSEARPCEGAGQVARIGRGGLGGARLGGLGRRRRARFVGFARRRSSRLIPKTGIASTLAIIPPIRLTNAPAVIHGCGETTPGTLIARSSTMADRQIGKKNQCAGRNAVAGSARSLRQSS